MNRHYIVSNDIRIYSIGNTYIYEFVVSVCVCVCETNGVGLHARSGKRCLRVVRSSWAEEKPPKTTTTTTIGSVQRGYTYIYILLLFTCLLHQHIYIYIIIYRYSYIVHVARIIHILYIQCRACVYFFFRVRDRLDTRASVLSLLFFFSARTNSLPV